MAIVNPTLAGMVPTNNLMRAISRQLVSYEGSTDPDTAIKPVGPVRWVAQVLGGLLPGWTVTWVEDLCARWWISVPMLALLWLIYRFNASIAYKIKDAAVPYDITAPAVVDMFFKVGEKAKALEIAGIIGPRAIEMAEYQTSKYSGIPMEVRRNLFVLGELQRILYENGENDQAKKYEDAYQRIIQGLQIREGIDSDR